MATYEVTVTGTNFNVSLTPVAYTATLSQVGQQGATGPSGTITSNTGATIGGDLAVDTDTLFVDASTNRVGIGTSSPERLLHIRRGAGAGSVLSGSTYLAVLDSDSDSVLQFRTPNTNSAWIRFSDPESFGVGAIEYDHSVNALKFDVNASEAMRIDSSGNVGIGTSSPSAKLEVIEGNADAVSIKTTGHIQLYDNTNVTRAYTFLSRDTGASMVGGNIRLDASVTTGSHVGYSSGTNLRGGSGIIFGNTSLGAASYGDTIFVQSNDTNDDTWVVRETMRITSTGNVGIGTSNPGYALDVQTASGDANARIYARGATSVDDAILYLGIAGTTATNRINFGNVNDADRGRIIYGHSDDYMSFTTAASEAMRIDSSGNVGIGTTTPGSKLSVVGLPTSSAGLSAGDIWNDSGTLKIV